MAAAVYDIISREKDILIANASIEDFVLAQASEIDPVTALQDRTWSLYCLDFSSNCGVFVQLPSELDLARAAFVYQTQFEKAQSVLVVPFADLIVAAERMPDPEHLTFLLSTGRCGSTLASRILATAPDVWSISEPDVFTSIAYQRTHLTAAARRSLLNASTRLLFRPPVGRAVTSYIIKPRSEAVLVSDDIAEAMPSANYVFLYRDIAGYANSMHRFLQRVLPAPIQNLDPEHQKLRWRISSVGAPDDDFPNWFPGASQNLHHTDFMALGWTVRMKAARELMTRRPDVCAIHYADLNHNRRIETARLLTACKIEGSDVERALTGFEKDAHSGTAGENKVPARPLGADAIARVKERVSTWNMPLFEAERL